MKKDIGWRILTAICVSVALRPLIQDDVYYLITCFFAGVILAVIGEYLDNKK
jgi:hypothetical protein